MGWIGSIRCEKSRRDIVPRTFAIITLVQPNLHRVSCSYETIPNAPEHYETQQNDQVRWLRTITTRFRGTNFCLIAPNLSILQQVSCSYETIPNAPKYYKTHRKNSIGSNGVDWLCLLRKIPTWLCVTNFFDNCTSSVCFASCFMQLRNDPKCTEILWNRPKH